MTAYPLLITQSNFDLLTVGVAGAAIGFIGFLVFLNNRKSITNRTFLYFALFTIFWTFTNFFQYKFNGTEETLWALRINLFVAAWHAFFFFRFCVVFPKDSVLFPRWYARFIIPAVAITALLTLTPFVFSGISVLAPAGHITNPERGVGIILFSFVTFSLLFFGLGILLRRVFKETGAVRLQTVYVFIGMMLTALFILFFSVLLPIFYNTLTYLPFAAVFMFPFIALVSYSIYRTRLFNLKAFGAAVLSFALAISTFVEIIFTQETTLVFFRSFVLILIIVIGIILTRSVSREVELREEVEQLALNLEAANEKLKELDKLKSQFLSIASHDLRAPLTIIRNFMSLLLDGTYGKLPAAGQEGLQQVFDRATDMAKSVETYLNVSRIEQGRMKYDFIDVALVPLVTNAANAFKPNAEKKGLSFSFTAAPALEGKKAKLDVAKINEVLNNLFDNSIKYTPKGSIAAILEKKENVARLTIKDTGVGMSKETVGKLFQLFSTAENSRKVNTTSTGVGLYITKAHVAAHGGKVWAESEGEGKGSSFILELPLLL